MTLVDFSQIKVGQRVMWGSGDYAAVASKIHPIAEELAQATGLPAGSRVLDVATGSGNAAIAAARYDYRVTGLDYVPGLLARARVRAKAEGLPVEFVEGDAENLPFPDGSFDAVLSVVGVMFAPNQAKAAAEMVRVCRPGGLIALVNWTPDAFVGDMFRTIAGHVPPPPGVLPPVRWGTREGIHELLGDAAASIEITRCEFTLRAVSAEKYVGFMLANFGPLVRAQSILGPEGSVRLRKDLIRLCHHHNRATDTLALPAAYLRVLVRTAEG